MSDTSSQSSESSMDDRSHRCPICLQEIADKSYIDPCYHQYCIQCIRQWIRQSPRCPLCNRQVTSLIRYNSVTNEPYRISITANRVSPSRTIQYGRNEQLDRAQVSLGLRKRQAVYRYHLHRVSSNGGQRARVSGSRELLARELRTERCRGWIKRDLQVILQLDSGLKFFETLVLSVMDDRENRMGLLEGVLGDSAGLFVSELMAFADSSLDMYCYDRYIAYNTLT